MLCLSLRFQELHTDVFNVDTGRSGKEGGETVDDAGTVNPDELVPPNMKGSATAVWNTVKDLHLELILMYHRVTLKLANLAAPGRCSWAVCHCSFPATGEA